MPSPELPIVADVTITGINEATAETVRECFMAGINRAVDELVAAQEIDLTPTDVTNTYTSTLGEGTVTISLSANIAEESLKTVAQCAYVHALGGMAKLGLTEVGAYLAELGRDVMVGFGETLTSLGSNLVKRFGGERDAR